MRKAFKILAVIALVLLLGRFLMAQVDSLWIEYKPGYFLTAYMPTSRPGPLPTVVMIHGGGYQIGSRFEYSLEGYQLALSGYLALSIDYRLGWNVNAPCDPVTGIGAALYKAMQDCKEAVNYPGLPMDPNRLFVFGESAGAATALHWNLTASDWGQWDTVSLGSMPTAPKAIGLCVEQGQLSQQFIHRASYHGLLLTSIQDGHQWFDTVICNPTGGSEAVSFQLYATGYCVRKVYRCDGVHDGWTHSEQSNEMIGFFGSILSGSCQHSIDSK